jgi:hypothetical protein
MSHTNKGVGLGEEFDPITRENLELPNGGNTPVLAPGKRGRPRAQNGEKFIKGPVPLGWVLAAAQLPGKALGVGMMLWHEAGCRRKATIPVNLSTMPFGRKAAYRGLASLEGAGLVTVEKKQGQRSLVTILAAPSDRTRTVQEPTHVPATLLSTG